jgi:hypothetical protein
MIFQYQYLAVSRKRITLHANSLPLLYKQQRLDLAAKKTFAITAISIFKIASTMSLRKTKGFQWEN